MLPWQAQLELVRSLLSSPQTCMELTGTLQPTHFENPALGAIATGAMEIYRQYGAVATEGQLQAFFDSSCPPTLGAACLALLPDVLAATVPSSKWAVEQGRHLAASAELLKLGQNSRAYVQQGQFDEFLKGAREAAALAAPRGHVTTGAGDIIARHRDGGPPGVPLSVLRLNKSLKGHGLQPGRLLIYLGVENGGKTHALVSDGAVACLHGFRVAHCTLEDSANDIRCRYDHSFTGFGDDLYPNLPGLVPKLQELHDRLTVIEAVDRPLTVAGLRAAVDRIPDERAPHLLIVDYGQLLAAGTSHSGDDVAAARRLDLSDIYQQLRILGQSRKIPVLTAYQSNRSGFQTQDSKTSAGEANVLRARHFSDAIGPAFHADVIVSINQTPGEMASRTGRLFLDKNRCGPKNLEIACVFRWDKSRIRDITDPELLAAGGTLAHGSPDTPLPA